MSWLYSRALVEAYWADTYSDGTQSALSSQTPTPQAFLPSDKMTVFSRPSRSGMTFAPLTESLGTELLTWFLAGFRAKTSALQGEAQESAVSDQGYGEKWPESLARYDPDSRSWKTAQYSLLGGLDEFSGTWPKWGTMRNGECWERQTLERRTSEIGYGYWPTPTVSGNYNRKGASKTSGEGLATAASKWPTPSARDAAGANSAEHLSKPRGHHDQLPNRVKMVSLGMAEDPARTWPTPTSRDYKGESGNHSCLPKEVKHENGAGQLNPEWVEWLMGWPQGWTALNHLGMDKFREWQRQHSLSCTDEHLAESNE